MSEISVRQIGKVFDSGAGHRVQALEAIDFHVPDGQIFSIIGPSGCGKSTILEIVAGFVPPSAGSVLVAGSAVSAPGPDRTMVFQQPNLFPWLTVLGNVMFGPRVQGRRDMKAAIERARHLLDLCGLRGFEDRYPYQLSGGMRQRVAIVRALINEPRVLLMDEPFGALDAQTRLTMQELLLTIWQEFSPTILFVTHDIEEALFLGTRIGLMSRRPGRMKLDLTVPLGRPRTTEMLTDPAFVAMKARLLNELRTETERKTEE
jgi:NitT/TauT family transport system ATP-binding protein